MDAKHFDRLARSLTALGTRRGLLAVLAAVPVTGGLLAGLDPADTQARSRRKRRKTRHQHQKGDGKQNRKGKRKGNNNNKTKTKTEDCDGIACPGCETCQNNICSSPCDGAGCCALDTCLAGTDDTACGAGGAACVACSGTTPVCDQGSCVACSATNPCPGGLCCAGGQCGVTCPTCQTCTSGLCQAVANNTVACDGSPLFAGVCAFDGLGVCVDGACSCAGLVYDPNSNRCLCTAEQVADCASQPGFTCCVESVCTSATGTLTFCCD